MTCMTTLMLNGYYDVHFDWPVTPFFGAGVGAAFLDGTTKFVGGQTVPGRDDTEVAFQGVIGATYSLTYRWRLGFDARYIGTGDDDVNVILLGLNARYDMLPAPVVNPQFSPTFAGLAMRLGQLTAFRCLSMFRRLRANAARPLKRTPQDAAMIAVAEIQPEGVGARCEEVADRVGIASCRT